MWIKGLPRVSFVNKDVGGIAIDILLLQHKSVAGVGWRRGKSKRDFQLDLLGRHVLIECPNFKELRKAVWPYNSQPQSFKEILNQTWSAKKTAQYMVQTSLLGQFLGPGGRLEVTN